MNDDLFNKRLSALRERGEQTAFTLAAVAEALDTVAHLNEHNTGGETVETRIGEYKNWDPDVFRVDRDVEDGFRRRLEQRGEPVILLSEEAGRVVIGRGEPAIYAIADPFDGSWLFKRGIPDFWFSSLAFYDRAFNPLCCAVGNAVTGEIAFADGSGAYVTTLRGEQAAPCVRLDAAYRAAMGRKDLAEPEHAGIESYAMKPKKFLLPLVDRYRTLLERFKFFLPNGGPNGFIDVAAGRIDVYFAQRQPYVDVFSGIQIAQQAGVVVTGFSGEAVHADDNHETLHDVVASTNRALHERVLELIAQCRQEE